MADISRIGDPQTSPTRLESLAGLSAQLAGTRSRLDLMRLLGDFLRGLPPEDRPLAARLLIGRPFPEGDPRKLDVSGATLWRVASAVAGAPDDGEAVWGEAVDFGQAVERLFLEGARIPTGPGLTLQDVGWVFDAVASQRGRGARKAREEILTGLFGRATPSEAKFLAKCVLGDMRHGVSEGVLLDAVARATGTRPETVRRAAMLLGDVGEVVRRGFDLGADALAAVAPRLFHPIKPMLAQTAHSLEEAWDSAPGRLAMEYKLDGARIQIHLDRDEVRLFSRRLHDVTDSLPDIVAQVRGATASRRAVLEGEAIAVDASGRVRPFQDLLQRYRRVHHVEDVQREVPLRLYLFDLLVDGEEALFDRTYAERWQRLVGVHGGLPLVPRCTPQVLAEAQAFWKEALEAGHEGVMLKRLDSPYTPGVRGGSWHKLKRANNLDLVIIAADHGYGRRHGWLSNYHLAARDEETGEFRPVGKTFKGLTDEEFRSMTARLLAIRRGEEGGTVWVDPMVVVEVQYSDLQKSPLYPDGMALRFARIARIRDDKSPAEADTLQFMRRLFQHQGSAPDPP
ncbi:MAG TPA: ATP-dependent DNA ligase [Candidatus Methylomirabilis sp.]|nr:ATP-dependent DNA ligase [Candidatus Methylomirabilis sp.]